MVAVFLAALTIIVPRKYFLLPYVLAACFVPTDQRIIVMGLDFTVLRILVVVGVLRTLIYGEQIRLKWNKLDQMILAWAICGAVVYVIQQMDINAIINRSGVLFDVIGLYWLFRQRIRSWNDVRFVFTLLAFSALVLAPLVALEWSTGQNPFVILGRVVTSVRSGRYRCQAAFPHSIMLGLFWATLVPIFIGLARTEKRRYFYWAATGATVYIIFGTASSTPLAVLPQIILLTALFPYRIYGRLIFYGLCGITAGLHVIMNHPVWHLITYMNIVGGSTGWHRFYLVDQAIKHFDEWALLGTYNTAHWGYGLQDVTNQYLRQGVNGGFITLVCFVTLLVMAVKTVGVYSIRVPQAKLRFLSWCVCVSILGHCLSFMGVSYFGQIKMLFYLTFAVAGLVCEMSGRPAAKKLVPVPATSR